MKEAIIASGVVKFAHVYKRVESTVGHRRFYSIVLTSWRIDGDVRGFDFEKDGVAHFFSERQPVVVKRPGRYSLSTLLRCAEDSNIRTDDLFVGTTVRVALSKIEHDQMRPGSFTRPSRTDRVRKLIMNAVEVDADAMTTVYDNLCRNAFGESWPEMIVRQEREKLGLPPEGLL
jgi:hypothetical protein